MDALKLYRIPELAKMLKVTERTILKYFETGKLKGVKIGGKWTVSEKNLHSFLNGESQPPACQNNS